MFCPLFTPYKCFQTFDTFFELALRKEVISGNKFVFNLLKIPQVYGNALNIYLCMVYILEPDLSEQILDLRYIRKPGFLDFDSARENSLMTGCWLSICLWLDVRSTRNPSLRTL